LGIALALWLSYTGNALAGLVCYGYEYAPNLVRAVQTHLKEKRFYKGAVDGKWGQRTEAAVAKFQLSKGIHFSPEDPSRGQLDDQTLHALFGDDAPSGVTITPNPHHAPDDIWRRYCH
jgi:hypothetical protein